MKGILIIGLIVGIILFGCTSSSGLKGQVATDFTKNIPEIKQFLDEHPNSKVVATYWDETAISESISSIKESCGNQFRIKPYYRVSVTSDDLDLLVWVDENQSRAECVLLNSKGTVKPKVSVETITPTSTPTIEPIISVTPTPTPNVVDQKETTCGGFGGFTCIDFAVNPPSSVFVLGNALGDYVTIHGVSITGKGAPTTCIADSELGSGINVIAPNGKVYIECGAEALSTGSSFDWTVALQYATSKAGVIKTDSGFVRGTVQERKVTVSPIATKTVDAEAKKYLKTGESASYLILVAPNGKKFYMVQVGDKNALVFDESINVVTEENLLAEILIEFYKNAGSYTGQDTYPEARKMIKFYNERKEA